MISVGLLGSVPESIRTVLRAGPYDIRPTSDGDITIAHARGDWPAFPKGSVVIAVCDTLEDAAAAYRAGATFVAPPDPEVVKLLIERAQERTGVRPLANLEREAILSAMKASAGSTARAAAMLDISVRKVQYKLHEYGIPLTRRSKSSPPTG